jgi:hypothetical protein
MDGGEVAIKTEGKNLKSPSKFECSALKKRKTRLENYQMIISKHGHHAQVATIT